MDYNLSDFRVNYTDIHVKNMVKIPNPQRGKYKHNFTGSENITKTSVQFNIFLLNCNTIPAGIRVLWDFGDGVTSNDTVATFQKSHGYSARGTYTFVATFSNGSEQHSEKGTVYIGIAQGFSVSPLNVTVGSRACFNVTVHADLLSMVQQYSFYTDDGLLQNTTLTQICHTFTSFGIHIPYAYVLLTNGLGEVLYSVTQMAVNVNLSRDLSRLISQNDPVHLPPGNNSLVIEVGHLHIFPEGTTCNVTSGDKVNRTIFTFEYPLRSVTYRHYSLGTMTATAHCFNSISEFTTEHQFKVINPCFGEDERLDRQYSMPSTPLDVSVTQDLLLYARSVVICNRTSSLYWTVEIVNLTQNQNIDYVDVGFDNYADPSKNVLLIPKYSLTTGLYKITSFVSVASASLNEYIFVRFVLPHPTAFIMGGNNVLVKEERKIELDAENSYQQEIGDGGRLTYSWNCTR
jgi:PKD repeat protein